MPTNILYKAAQETLKEYFSKTSLNGCHMLHFIKMRKNQRIVWFIFLFMAVLFATYVCSTVLMTFLEEPTVTTLDLQEYTIYEAPFPSVAVCSNNKFSRKALQAYASDIALRSETNQTLAYWMQKLEYLSGLYNYDSVDFKEAGELHFELESTLGEDFATSKILGRLAPTCADLLVKCFWDGRVIDCKQQFELKIFMDGPCCVFNYQHMKDSNTLRYPNDTGPRHGLTFIVNTSTNDYFYQENNAIGFTVKLFATQFIPDARVSELEEFYVGVGQDVSVELRLVSQVATEDIRFYSVHKRGCSFPFERGQSSYDYSECIVKCKIRVIEENCECVPFFVINSGIERKNSETKECSLLHLGCLAFFKFEFVESIECVNCYPMCSFNQYSYWKTMNRLKHSLQTWNNQKYLETAHMTDDISLVKIFYRSEMAVKYKKDVLYKWNHILSYIGGVMGICMGCSIINVIEIIYFAGYRLIENFFKFRRAQMQIHN